MDSDRKSAVSSFYGGRKSSFNPLNNNVPSQSPADPDAASSFFNPGRASRASLDPLNGQQPHSAGYNSLSFLHTGREEPLRGGRDEEEHDGAWDVFADFNNTGPRYSAALGQHDERQVVLYAHLFLEVVTIALCSYQQFPQPMLKPEEDTESNTGPVEMVTVPGMGPEWQRSELRDMTKAGKREKKVESRKQKWKQWNRDERGLCGKWFKRKFLVYFLFALCVVCVHHTQSLAITLISPSLFTHMQNRHHYCNYHSTRSDFLTQRATSSLQCHWRVQ